MIVPVTDPDDPRVAGYGDIRERDRVGRDGLFVAEGEVVLRMLLGPASRFAPASVLVAGNRLPAILALAEPRPELPVFVAAPAVMDRIAGFPIHRGILALGRIGDPTLPHTILDPPGPALVVAGFGIANHDNLGGIFRNAAAFAARGVLLDPASTNPLYRKAIRVAVGTTLTLPFARFDAAEDIPARLLAAGFDLVALTPHSGDELRRLARTPRMALLLGAEGPGLPPGILARARTVRIPMAAGVNSLNVAVTSGIVLHHLAG